MASALYGLEILFILFFFETTFKSKLSRILLKINIIIIIIHYIFLEINKFLKFLWFPISHCKAYVRLRRCLTNCQYNYKYFFSLVHIWLLDDHLPWLTPRPHHHPQNIYFKNIDIYLEKQQYRKNVILIISLWFYNAITASSSSTLKHISQMIYTFEKKNNNNNNNVYYNKEQMFKSSTSSSSSKELMTWGKEWYK